MIIQSKQDYWYWTENIPKNISKLYGFIDPFIKYLIFLAFQIRDLSCFYWQTIWKCSTLANNFILVAFLKLHNKGMKGMFAHYSDYYASSIWSHTLCLASAGDSCNVNSGQRLQCGLKKLAWAKKLYKSYGSTFPLWSLPEVDAIKIRLRYAYPFLDVNLKFPKAHKWVDWVLWNSWRNRTK